MSKRSARTFEDDQECMIDAVTDVYLKGCKCEDCEWGMFPGECKELTPGGRCADFQASYSAFERVMMRAEDEVHSGVWVKVDKN